MRLSSILFFVVRNKGADFGIYSMRESEYTANKSLLIMPNYFVMYAVSCMYGAVDDRLIPYLSR